MSTFENQKERLMNRGPGAPGQCPRVGQGGMLLDDLASRQRIALVEHICRQTYKLSKCYGHTTEVT